MKEFQIIEHFFAHHPHKREDVILGVGDDCAILRAPVDQQLVMTTDTLVENIHFLPKTSAADLGYRALAISLSDIAAMGAEPTWVLLSLTLPQAEEKWLAEFAEGFYLLLDHYKLALVGGNITKGPLTLTTQVTGFLPLGEGMRRKGAKPGDLIYVTGTLGDAGVALAYLQKKIKIPEEFRKDLLNKLYRPSPRVEEGITLRKIATAAIDISDGLAADLSHILIQSDVGATIKTDKLPLSKALRTFLKPEDAWRYALSSGDDYELCFTIPASLQPGFELIFGSYDCGYICIGRIEEQPGLRILDSHGKEFKIDYKGYEHLK